MRVRMQATLAGLCEFWKRRYFLKQVTALSLHVLSSSQMFESVTSLSTMQNPSNLASDSVRPTLARIL